MICLTERLSEAAALAPRPAACADQGPDPGAAEQHAVPRDRPLPPAAEPAAAGASDAVAAFDAFYAEVARPLWGYLRALSGDAATADDLLQESFLRLLTARGAPSEPPERRRYLFRIAAHLLADRGRRRRIAERHRPEAGQAPPHAPLADPRPRSRARPRRALAARTAAPLARPRRGGQPPRDRRARRTAPRQRQGAALPRPAQTGRAAPRPRPRPEGRRTMTESTCPHAADLLAAARHPEGPEGPRARSSGGRARSATWRAVPPVATSWRWTRPCAAPRSPSLPRSLRPRRCASVPNGGAPSSPVPVRSLPCGSGRPRPRWRSAAPSSGSAVPSPRPHASSTRSSRRDPRGRRARCRRGNRRQPRALRAAGARGARRPLAECGGGGGGGGVDRGRAFSRGRAGRPRWRGRARPRAGRWR